MKLTLRSRLAILSVVLVAASAACGNILGIESGRLEPDASTPEASTETDATITDALPDLTQPDSPSLDAGSDGASGCSARTVDDATGVFVALYGVDGASCGTRATPCRTVATGIAQAALLQRSTVYIARGTYTESVTLGSGMTLEGGWDTVSSSWVPICDVNELSAVSLQMPSSTNVAVTVGPGAMGARLRYLSVLGKATANPGESVYGVFALNSSLTLDSVIVSIGPGGTGDAGANGNPGAAGVTGCDAGSGANGGAAGAAPQTPAGTLTAGGYVASTGLPGSSDGGAGTAGPCTLSPSCITSCSTCLAVCPKPTSGCGGPPGTGGGGGQGGGSSIAVYTWNTQLTVVGGALSAGNGGNGGNGGSGGPGGQGGPGTASQAACLSFCGDAGCGSVGNTTLANASNGGTGGAGGHGGGGAGGFSYAIYTGGDAGSLTTQSSPALAHGQAGQGGAVNGVAGQAGNTGP